MLPINRANAFDVPDDLRPNPVLAFMPLIEVKPCGFPVLVKIYCEIELFALDRRFDETRLLRRIFRFKTLG